ncbi:MAG: hypothetical protein AAF438_02190 [Pseudomonadota bacterium]
MNKKNIPWAQISIEATAIVLSILLAFWIDAWWSNKQQRVTEREYLQAMLGEIHAIVAEANRTIKGNEKLNENARGRIAAFGIDAVPNASMTKTILTELTISYRLRASLDTYTDLLSSGSILTLNDINVRNSLSKLRSQMDFEQEVFRWVVDFGHRITPRLHEVISNEKLDQLALIEEHVIVIRDNHIRRKQEVIEAAGIARDAILNYCEDCEN